MGRHACLHNDLNQTELSLRSNYLKNRNFIARFLHKNLKGPQAQRILEEFWYYRHEDEEVRHALGLPAKKGWQTGLRSAKSSTTDEERNEAESMLI